MQPRCHAKEAMRHGAMDGCYNLDYNGRVTSRALASTVNEASGQGTFFFECDALFSLIKAESDTGSINI